MGRAQGVEVRKRAVGLRRNGLSYSQIQETLGVSKGTLSLWLRDVPLTDQHREQLKRRKREAAMRGVRTMKARRREREERIADRAASQVGRLTKSELFVAGVVAYWAEGAKSKPWKNGQVRFTNSDPRMIQLFLAWLDLIGIGREFVGFRLAIHVSADVERSLGFWSEMVRVPVEQFKRTTLKRGNPRTRRKNVGRDYHGCLRVEVLKSGDLNTRIGGWFRGIMSYIPTR